MSLRTADKQEAVRKATQFTQKLEAEWAASVAFFMMFQSDADYGCSLRLTTLRITNTKIPSIPPKTSDKVNTSLGFDVDLNCTVYKS